MGGRRGMDTGITKGLASMYKSMTDDDEEEEDLLVSGKDIKADVKNYRLHTNMLSDSMSIIMKLVKAIAEHGVHPDRANGNIYRIRL